MYFTKLINKELWNEEYSPLFSKIWRNKFLKIKFWSAKMDNKLGKLLKVKKGMELFFVII